MALFLLTETYGKEEAERLHNAYLKNWKKLFPETDSKTAKEADSK